MARQSDGSKDRSIDFKMLVLAAVAAVVAAVVTSAIWGRGELISIALTPVIVALVQEALRRPAERVTATAARVAPVPVRGTLALSRASTAQSTEITERFDGRRLQEVEHGTIGGKGTNGTGATAPLPPPPLDDTRSYDPTRSIGAGDPPRAGDTAPAAAAGQPTERKVYGRRRFRLKHALLTALAAGLVAAVVLTASELALGGSVSGDRTSLFGGSRDGQADERGSGGDSSEDGSDSSGESSSGAQSAPEAAPAPEGEEPVEEDPVEEDPVEEEPAPEEPVVPSPSGSGSATEPTG